MTWIVESSHLTSGRDEDALSLLEDQKHLLTNPIAGVDSR